MQKRRRHKRIKCDARVDYGSSTEVLLDHDVQNLSLGGACLAVSTVQPMGSKVLLVLSFPDMDDISIEVEGEVVWANDEHPRDIGIAFLDMEDTARQVLKDYIARHLGADGE